MRVKHAPSACEACMAIKAHADYDKRWGVASLRYISLGTEPSSGLLSD